MSHHNSDDLSADPRFLELHEELRHVVFNGISNLSSSRWATPEPADAGQTAGTTERTLDFSAVNIPRVRLIGYLQNWVTDCAPVLDKFDTNRHFQIQVPLVARNCPALLYAVLTFSSRQMERRGLSNGFYDSLELYQQSIRLLGPSLQAKDPSILVTACILAVFELMSGSSKDWRRHLEGCAALFEFFGVDGFSGGLAQTVFWCYARMDLCGCIISGGMETTMFPVSNWTPDGPAAMSSSTDEEARIQELFFRRSRACADTFANWAVYLCVKVCDFKYRRTRSLELGKMDQQDTRPLTEQWRSLWSELRYWLDNRTTAMLPNVDGRADEHHVFPTILFAHRPAISGNQLYHTACILMLEMRPQGQVVAAPECSPVWHARRVCGISVTNPHRGSRINAIQPLYIAGRLFTHPSERIEIVRLLKTINHTTGWGALSRVRDLEAEWGYEYGELSDAA